MRDAGQIITLPLENTNFESFGASKKSEETRLDVAIGIFTTLIL